MSQPDLSTRQLRAFLALADAGISWQLREKKLRMSLQEVNSRLCSNHCFSLATHPTRGER